MPFARLDEYQLHGRTELSRKRFRNVLKRLKRKARNGFCDKSCHAVPHARRGSMATLSPSNASCHGQRRACDARDEHIHALLILDAMSGQVQVMEELLEARADNTRGTDGNRSREDGWTPTPETTYSGFTDIVELLVGHRAYVNCTSKGAWTPLHLVARNGFVKVVPRLLQHHANATAAPETGFTSLQSAAQSSSLNSVRTLLNRGVQRLARQIATWRWRYVKLRRTAWWCRLEPAPR
eukprot:1718640-Amphidinium_carterae.1